MKTYFLYNIGIMRLIVVARSKMFVLLFTKSIKKWPDTMPKDPKNQFYLNLCDRLGEHAFRILREAFVGDKQHGAKWCNVCLKEYLQIDRHLEQKHVRVAFFSVMLPSRLLLL